MKHSASVILAPLAFIASCASAAALTACNSSGEVLMSKIATSPQGDAPSATQARSSSASAGDPDPIVYFDRVSVRDGKPETLIGLGFLRDGALTQNAFGLRFKAPGTFADRPRLDAHAGVIYLRPDGLGHERLLKLDPSRLDETELARLPQGISDVAVSDDLRSVAWTDALGEAFAAFNGTPAQALPLQGSIAAMLAFAPESSDLQIGFASTTLVFRGRADSSESLPGSLLAREPRSGRLATDIQSDAGLEIQVSDPRNATQVTIPVEGLALLDLQWSADGQLAFLVEQKDNSLALMKATPETGETALLAPLSLAASPLAGRIVCPAWFNDSLYFGDVSGSSFGIFRAVSIEGSWTVLPFARTSTNAQGFVCPKLSQKTGGRS